MPLSPEDIERFARQVVIPDVGAAGQERLLDSRVALIGAPEGTSVAEEYLRCSGVGLASGDDLRSADCILVAGLDQTPAAELDRASTSGTPIAWYELTATGFRCGSRAAGEQSALGPGERESLPEDETGAVHAAAACEAVATAIALLLGWESSPTPLEVELA